jgi:hypothetical protein
MRKKTEFQRKQDARLRARAGKKTKPLKDQDAKPARVEETASLEPGQQELWSGAGIWLDWREITSDDFDSKVQPRLTEIEDADLQLSFLSTLWHATETGCTPILEEAQGWDDKDAAKEYGLRAAFFANRIINAHRQLEHMARLDEPQDEEVERLTIAQCVWAIHYLLAEAGMAASIDKATVARFISALTNYKFSKVYRRVVNKYGERSERVARADLSAVRAHFVAMGLVEIAEKISREMAD